jgi:hypothetical protein
MGRSDGQRGWLHWQHWHWHWLWHLLWHCSGSGTALALALLWLWHCSGSGTALALMLQHLPLGATRRLPPAARCTAHKSCTDLFSRACLVLLLHRRTPYNHNHNHHNKTEQIACWLFRWACAQSLRWKWPNSHLGKGGGAHPCCTTMSGSLSTYELCQ